MVRPASCLLALVAAGLTACTGLNAPAIPGAAPIEGGGAPPPQAAVGPQGPVRIAALLPLSGPNAPLGQAMLQAAQLALGGPDAPPLDVKDTGGDPQRAAAAAADAVQHGDTLILGPLTAAETEAVAPVSQPANLPVLAFTSDPAAARPGVWTLGVTPRQQVRLLVTVSRDEGRQHLAAILPQTPLGDAMATALGEAASEAGLSPPRIERYAPGFAGLNGTLKSVSDYQSRRGDAQAAMRKARETHDPAARAAAAALAAQPVPPPAFDALLVAETGEGLKEMAELLPFYDVTQPKIRVLGPALWAAQIGHLGKLAGAWFAAPDPAARTPFVTAFQAKYGAPPPPLADIAFDAAAIAAALAQNHDFSPTALTRDDGFAGVDGLLALSPDGHVRRALAVFEVDPDGGAHIARPAPQDLSSPAS